LAGRLGSPRRASRRGKRRREGRLFPPPAHRRGRAVRPRGPGHAEGAARTTDGGRPLRGSLLRLPAVPRDGARPGHAGQEALASVFFGSAAATGAGLAASSNSSRGDSIAPRATTARLRSMPRVESAETRVLRWNVGIAMPGYARCMYQASRPLSLIFILPTTIIATPLCRPRPATAP